MPYTHKKYMIIYYVLDKTINPPQDKRFQEYSQFVQYLGEMCKRAYGQDQKQRTRLLEELGNGADDYNSTLFVRSMQEAFEIGIVRDGRRTQCDVTVLVAFHKPEYGD